MNSGIVRYLVGIMVASIFKGFWLFEVGRNEFQTLLFYFLHFPPIRTEVLPINKNPSNTIIKLSYVGNTRPSVARLRQKSIDDDAVVVIHFTDAVPLTLKFVITYNRSKVAFGDLNISRRRRLLRIMTPLTRRSKSKFLHLCSLLSASSERYKLRFLF